MATNSLNPAIVKPSSAAVVTRFLLASLIGIALTIAGELSAPWDLDNAIAVGQTGLIILAVTMVLTGVGVRWPVTVRWLLLALAVLTPLTAVAYFLPLAWMLGCAGVALAWGAGAFTRDTATPHTRLHRACGLVCGFVAAAWFIAYLSAVVTDLL